MCVKLDRQVRRSINEALLIGQGGTGIAKIARGRQNFGLPLDTLGVYLPGKLGRADNKCLAGRGLKRLSR